jgi:hypothetical protein
MALELDALRVLQGVIVALGLVVIYYASRGYRRTHGNSLLFLAFGFMFVTIGAIAAGLLFELMNFSLVFADTIQAGSEVVGFGLIVYSIVGAKD